MWRSWRTQADLEATARELAAETNRRILPLAADVTSKEQVERVVAEAARQLGGLHILVNSGSHPGGSTTATGPIETVVDEELMEDFNIKYVGALRCARAVIPFMKDAGWGRIIDISGGNARNAGNLSGGARNAALVHMTKTLSVQFGRHGITVNCIHPGTTRTERTPSLLAARATQLGVPPEEAERQDFAPDCRAAMPSAAWWTLRRSRSSRSSWPRIRPGRSPASCCRQAAGPGGRYITKQRFECVSVDFSTWKAVLRLIGYTRVSTWGRRLPAQLEQLRHAGCSNCPQSLRARRNGVREISRG